MMRPQRRHRALRMAVTVILIVAAAAALWTWVFPWVDRTFVNRPEIGAIARLSPF